MHAGIQQVQNRVLLTYRGRHRASCGYSTLTDQPSSVPLRSRPRSALQGLPKSIYNICRQATNTKCKAEDKLTYSQSQPRRHRPSHLHATSSCALPSLGAPPLARARKQLLSRAGGEHLSVHPCWVVMTVDEGGRASCHHTHTPSPNHVVVHLRSCRTAIRTHASVATLEQLPT